MVDLASGEEGVLASIHHKSGPRVGRYRVNLQDFERIALPALRFSLEHCELTCVDELGTMEFFSRNFQQQIDQLLNLDHRVIAVVHRHYVERYKRRGSLFWVTPENRDDLVNTIFTRVLQTRTPPKTHRRSSSSTIRGNDPVFPQRISVDNPDSKNVLQASSV